MRAWLALRDGVHYRRQAFADGLDALGYNVQFRLTDRPGPADVLVIWNRYGDADRCAHRFEARGRPVLVAENGYLGNEFCGDRWYAISRTHHNGAGSWPRGDATRWDALGVPLAPWRSEGELVVLPQRGIGPVGVAMPRNWLASIQHTLSARRVPYRVRPHPGQAQGIPLEVDLQVAGAVLTWGSGAALKALALGVPVFYAFPRWIGRTAALPLGAIEQEPARSDSDRLAMFRSLAWAQWRLSEIASGAAFRALLEVA